MHMAQIIAKKKAGAALSSQEIHAWIAGYVAGQIPDYQVSALLMAICWQGMDARETSDLTEAMLDSGDRMDLSALPGMKLDKHSTGGVGDKTTLIVAPAAAALGITVAKMSGRGLGHTGGTLDKLEAIPGLSCSMEAAAFEAQVQAIQVAVAGQTGKIAPADKALYALRDVTATVDNLSLIASSIMSKKLASGADAIVLDVKCGSGAFMQEEQEALALAEAMVEIGKRAGKKTHALVTQMDQPLGQAVGNLLEVYEAVEVLKGQGPQDLRDLCVALVAEMALLAGLGSREHCEKQAQEVLDDGRALARFAAMVDAQGGSLAIFEEGQDIKAPYIEHLASQETGYLARMDCEGIGRAACLLGAGRKTKEDVIDPLAGLILHRKRGDWMDAGEPWISLHASDPAAFKAAKALLEASITVSKAPVPALPLFLGRRN